MTKDSNGKDSNGKDSNGKDKSTSEHYQESEIERDLQGNWAQKSHLEKTLSAGMWGKPQIKREEKRKHLGEFRERVIKALTIDQIQEEGFYPEILESIKDPRAYKLVISSRADLSKARDYILMAHKNGLSFTTVDSPSYRGEIGLVVVSDRAVDEENIMVETPQEKYRKLGLPEELLEAEDGKVCSQCYQLIKEKAPEELDGYTPLGWWDKFSGVRCPVPHDEESK